VGWDLLAYVGQHVEEVCLLGLEDCRQKPVVAACMAAEKTRQVTIRLVRQDDGPLAWIVALPVGWHEKPSQQKREMLVAKALRTGSRSNKLSGISWPRSPGL
jgi:hypothetical protein